VHAIYDAAPVIAEIISAHCPGTSARDEFLRACVSGDWNDARAMTEGMLAEPWLLIGHQEARLREFHELLQLIQGTSAYPASQVPEAAQRDRADFQAA
jgi:hypothetical protein